MTSFVQIAFTRKSGCRGGSGDKPLAKDCNACLYVRNSVTGECLEECPKGWELLNNKTCKGTVDYANYVVHSTESFFQIR